MGKLLSAAMCLEFLVKSEELTTPTRVPQACGAASAGLEGFHWAGRCECWGRLIILLLPVRVALT